MTCEQMGKGCIKTAKCSCNDICVMNVSGINDDICHAHVYAYKGLIASWSSILCNKKANVEWHQKVIANHA